MDHGVGEVEKEGVLLVRFQKLDALGFIVTEKSGTGMQGKTTILSLPDVPARMVRTTLEKLLKRKK